MSRHFASDISSPGHFTPRTFRPLEMSPSPWNVASPWTFRLWTFYLMGIWLSSEISPPENFALEILPLRHFVPLIISTFRTQTFFSLDITSPGHFFPGHFDIGHFSPWTLRPLDIFPGHFALRQFFSLDISSHEISSLGHFPYTHTTGVFMWGENIYSDFFLFIIGVLYGIILLLSGLVGRIKARDQSCWTLRATISSHNKSSMHENAQIFFTKTIFTIFLRHRSFVRTCHSLKRWYFVLTTLLLYSGCVQLDGVDIRDLNLAHIRDHIGTYCMVI